ncbi:hypothetical protein HanIR_Chr10g0489331 [Helianthus annuus]|nr:hypothetical protein HanIR_Chr10g0489331 [Helianthus annuus]
MKWASTITPFLKGHYDDDVVKNAPLWALTITYGLSMLKKLLFIVYKNRLSLYLKNYYLLFIL